MATRKLLKHELEDKVTELESELTVWKNKFKELNEQYEMLDEQNTVLQTQTDFFERVESKLEDISTTVNELQRPTITGFIFTFLDNLLFNKGGVIKSNNLNDGNNIYVDEVDYSSESESESEEEEEDNA